MSGRARRLSNAIFTPGLRRRFLFAALLGGLASSIFVVWMLFNIGGTHTTDAVDDIGELVAALAAAVLCAIAATRASAQRRAWILIAASSVTWAVGEALWSYYDLIQGVQVPFPSLADVFFVSAIPIMIAGLVTFPQAPLLAAHRAQAILDGCIISGSLVFASWATVLGPLYRSHQGTVLKQVLSLTYPASDAVMLSLVVILVVRAGPTRRTSLGLVMSGIVALAVADSSFAYFTEVNNYGIGTFFDTGWVVGFICIGLGALWHVTSPLMEPARQKLPKVGLVAPYVPALVVLAATAVALLRGIDVDHLSSAMAFGLVLLVIGREVLFLWDSRRNPRLAPPIGTSPWTALGRR